MKPRTTKEISQMMNAYLPAAALGTAMELGLFWLLGKSPLAVKDVAAELGIPISRCKHWLEYLAEMGLLDVDQNRYSPSETAQEAILDTRSRETWAFLAGEARERSPGVKDLALYITESGSVWEINGFSPSDYGAKMRQDPENARQFTRMLYELHLGEAEQLADSLDMTGVNRLLDIGGGSGVMSLALLRRHPDLEAVVVDQENVVTVGREIAIENELETRISYQVADFLEGDIPTGFDLILECDIGIYTDDLFRKFWHALNDGGRLVILDFSFDSAGADKLQLAGRNFYHSLSNPDFSFETVDELKAMLVEAGFRSFSGAKPITSGLYFESFK